MRSPALHAASWAKPKIDTGGLVLDLPLWRPDMVALGGNIESGTGTMAVTPVNLAVGANTITATGAGTFIVTMPQGGTVASGTATITGSPVTISAGVATSVTTGVTTGTFTVTTSNIIRSMDSTGHLCTVTGATWGYQGRTFDGDDFIELGNPTALQITGAAITVALWIKFTDANLGTVILSKWGDQSAYIMYFGGAGNPTFAVNTSSSVALTSLSTNNDGAWHFICGFYDGANVNLEVDNVAANTPAAQTGNIASASTTVRIARYGDAFTGYFIGNIGGVFIFNRSLPFTERLRLYQATKWRYT